MSDIDAKAPPHEETTKSINNPIDDHTSLVGKKSPGVVRVEALAAHITPWNRVYIFFGVFLIAYAYGLDGTLRYIYQPTATSDFNGHSLLATVNVLRAVIAAAAQVCAVEIRGLWSEDADCSVAYCGQDCGCVWQGGAPDCLRFLLRPRFVLPLEHCLRMSNVT